MIRFLKILKSNGDIFSGGRNLLLDLLLITFKNIIVFWNIKKLSILNFAREFFSFTYRTGAGRFAF
jgi:hypothetical protein